MLNFFLYGYVKEPEDVETKRQAQSGEFPTHNLSPLDTDYNPCLGNKNREEDAVSAEYMESLILLASKSNSSHSSEEEMVDITEPRFESFCMTNGTVTWKHKPWIPILFVHCSMGYIIRDAAMNSGWDYVLHFVSLLFWIEMHVGVIRYYKHKKYIKCILVQKSLGGLYFLGRIYTCFLFRSILVGVLLTGHECSFVCLLLKSLLFCG